MEKDSASGGYGAGDVEALLSKFSDVFSTVKSGSVIVLRISKSSGESFTLEKTGASFTVRSGDSDGADIVLEIDKQVFGKIKEAADLGAVLKEALASGQARAEVTADYLTLYRKGYLGAAQKLGLM